MPSSVTYRIADIPFTIQGDVAVAIARSLPGFDVFESQEPSDKHILRFGSELPCQGKGEVIYDLTIEGYRYRLYKGGADLTFTMTDANGNTVTSMNVVSDRLITAQSIADPVALRFAFWVAFNYFAAPYGAFGVHSSCIVHNSEAIIFLGESGTGKSTHTRLWRENIEGSFLLNDDSPIVVSKDGSLLVYGSPWSGKTDCYKQEHYPLRAVVRLSQAPHNKISKLNTLQAFSALYPSFPPVLAAEQSTQAMEMDAISNLIRCVIGVYSLECLPDAAAAELVRITVFGG